MSDQAAREDKLVRMHGGSREGQARLRQFNQTRSDWVGRCRKCGLARAGRLEDFGRPCVGCGHGG